MRLIGSKARKAVAEKLVATPDEEYAEVRHAQSSLGERIRDLEGFIDQAPEIQQRRKLETQVTLPPPEDAAALATSAAALELDGDYPGSDEEDPQERFGRRHLEAMRRERRTNFYVFLVSAAAVSAFLYWVSLVVR